MTFEHTIENQKLILEFEGDLIEIPRDTGLTIVIEDAIEQGVRVCAIDISKLRYMNSTGINTLILVLTKFRNRGGEVVLINPSDQIKNLLIITKLSAIFTIAYSKEEAMQLLEQELSAGTSDNE
ncbi:MAG TPA: anti-anti-sigma factor [Microscillaceae bacterium]|nr:anti-anti-sigma factor [Microscillaceae bacterium]